MTLLLVGCSQGSLSHVDPSEMPIESFTSTQELNRTLDQWKVNCHDIQACPNSVGQVLITNGRVLGLCTGTLIDNKYVLTNSHCFQIRESQSPRMADPQKICESGTRIVFASNSTQGANQLKCKKVVEKSVLSETYMNSDYLLFEVENTSARESDRVSRQGFIESEDYFMRKVNPVRRGFGELVIEKCRPVFRTVLVPRAHDEHFHIQVMKGCDAVSGNSGSSLVDNQGKVRGILFKGFAAETQRILNEFEKDIRNKAIKQKTTLITNATCMNFPFQESPDRDITRCSRYQLVEDVLQDALDSKEVQRFFESQKTFLLQDLTTSESLKSELRFVATNYTHYWAPYCIQSSLVNSDSPNLNLIVSTPVWFPEVGVRSDLSVYIKKMRSDLRTCRMSLNMAQFRRYGRGEVRLSGPGCVDSRGHVSPRELDIWNICP